MLLAIDIGNTNVTIGAFENDNLIFVSRLLTEFKLTEDQCLVNLTDVFSMHGISESKFNGAVISSVVPMLTLPMSHAVERLIGISPMIVGCNLITNIDFSNVDQHTLGSDLIIGSVAASSMYALPCIVIDLGTATTVTVINENRQFLGGCIIPGVKISLEALTEKAALLPAVSLEPPQSLICTEVTESIHSGAVYGTASMLDGLIDKIEQDLGYNCTIIVTGGLSSVIIPYCKKNMILCEHLVLYGLLQIFNLNVNTKT